MHRTPSYLLVEQSLGKSLARYVAARRKRDISGKRKSWNAIARDLRDDSGVAVTSETLRLWFGQQEKEAEASDRQNEQVPA